MNIEKKSPELRDIETIFPYPGNSKKHGKEQVEKLALSITKFGWRGNPILVDVNGVILAGHGRRLAALSIGLKKVPVIVEEMTPAEAKAFRLADNRVAISDMDTALFRQELESISVEDLRGIFDDKELEFSMYDLGEMNTDSFVDDLDIVVANQQAELDSQIEAAGSKRHALIKTFGFKDVSVENARTLSRIMSKIESEQGVAGEAALMHIFSLVGEE